MIRRRPSRPGNRSWAHPPAPRSVATALRAVAAGRARSRGGVLALVLVAVAAVSCQPAPESTLERARREGFLRAGYTEEPPYAYFDEGTGRVAGESPESLRRVVEELGIDEVRWVRLDFGDLIPSLMEGRVDVIAAGIFRTPEREEQVRFSRPTICSKSALLVPPTSRVVSISDVAGDTTLRIAVVVGSVEHAAARELGIAKRRILLVPDLTTGIAALGEGSADALAVTLPTARRAVSDLEHTPLEVRPYTPPPHVRTVVAGCSALAFRPEDESLVNAADRALARYVGSDRHLRALAELGFSREDLPPADGPR